VARTDLDRLPAAKERQADVIICDVMMLGTTGLQMQVGLVAAVSRAAAEAVSG
jgi:CheY-like chemotaxis protein